MSDAPGPRTPSPIQIAIGVGILLVASVVGLLASGGGRGSSSLGEPAKVPVSTGPTSTSPPISTPTPTATFSSPTPSTSASAEVEAITPSTATASGQAPDVPRSNGTVDSYGAQQAIDGLEATAWCVPGDGAGQFLELSFSSPVQVTGVGIVPGYDKIDPQTGGDRFKENRKILVARYTFDAGTVDVTFSGRLRRLQTTTFTSATRTTTVRIEPTSTSPPSKPNRDYTCISEVVIFGLA